MIVFLTQILPVFYSTMLRSKQVSTQIAPSLCRLSEFVFCFQYALAFSISIVHDFRTFVMNLNFRFQELKRIVIKLICKRYFDFSGESYDYPLLTQWLFYLVHYKDIISKPNSVYIRLLQVWIDLDSYHLDVHLIISKRA